MKIRNVPSDSELFARNRCAGNKACSDSENQGLKYLLTTPWSPPRLQTLGMSFTEVLELHVVTAGEDLACYTPEGGTFNCMDSTINGGLGAPALNATNTTLEWRHYFTLQINTSGSIVLRVIADGEEVDASPTLLDVIERR